MLFQSLGKWENAQYTGGRVAQLVRVPAGHHGDVLIALLWLRGQAISPRSGEHLDAKHYRVDDEHDEENALKPESRRSIFVIPAAIYDGISARLKQSILLYFNG